MLVELTLIAIFFTYAAILLCRLGGLVDVPNHRKQHLTAVPLAGGIAIFSTFLYATFELQLESFNYAVVTVLSGVFLLGLIDDKYQLRPVLRLVLHFFAGALIAGWAGLAIDNVGNLLGLGSIDLLLLTVPLTALSFAGLANAFNMIDGIDGLAAASVLTPLGVLLILAYGSGHPMTPSLIAVLLPLGVYLCFNLGPNSRAMPKIFLGDAGSVSLGFLVCANLVYFSQGDGALIKPVTALWLVALPLMDMLATMLRRTLRGTSPMAADRLHLHHNLIDAGFSARETLALLSLFSALCALLGLGLEAVPEAISLLLYFLLFCAYCLLVTSVDINAIRESERLQISFSKRPQQRPCSKQR